MLMRHTNTTLRLSLLGALAASAAFAAGCGKQESAGAPVTEAADAGAETPSPAAPEGEVLRTVETRSPFGNLEVPDNLMLDGDFEFTGRSGQMPWLAFGNSGQSTLNFATGGLCRSGIRCASIAAGGEMVGWMAMPKRGGVNVSIWAKPPSGTCADVRVLVFDLESQFDGESVRAESAKAGPSGWCHYESDVLNFTGLQPVLYVTTASARVQGPVLVDDAVARALPATQRRALALRTSGIDAATKVRFRFVADWIRRHRIYGLPESAGTEGPPSRLVDAPRTTLR